MMGMGLLAGSIIMSICCPVMWKVWKISNGHDHLLYAFVICKLDKRLFKKVRPKYLPLRKAATSIKYIISLLSKLCNSCPGAYEPSNGALWVNSKLQKFQMMYSDWSRKKLRKEFQVWETCFLSTKL